MVCVIFIHGETPFFDWLNSLNYPLPPVAGNILFRMYLLFSSGDKSDRIIYQFIPRVKYQESTKGE